VREYGGCYVRKVETRETLGRWVDAWLAVGKE